MPMMQITLELWNPVVVAADAADAAACPMFAPCLTLLPCTLRLTTANAGIGRRQETMASARGVPLQHVSVLRITPAPLHARDAC
jgi:hypothetical protein